MAVSVTVDHSAFGDDRFERLGELAGYNRHEALGRMVRLWSVCTELQTEMPPIARIQSALGMHGAAVLAESGLGEIMPDGALRVRGCTGRHEWYGEVAAQRVAAGKRRADGAKREKGRFVSAKDGPTSGTPAPPADGPAEHQRKPGSLVPLDVTRRITTSDPLVPLDQRDQRPPADGPADDQRPPASEQESERPEEERGPDLVVRPGSSSPDPDGAPRVEHVAGVQVPARASGAAQAVRAPAVESRRSVPLSVVPDARGEEQKRLLRELTRAHVEIFNRTRIAVGAKVPPMGVVGDPAERALLALLNSQVTLDGFEERARHVLAVREDEAIAQSTVKFLGASLWGSTFGVACSMAVGERRGPGAAPAKRSVFDLADEVLEELNQLEGKA